ncbi:ABC transporter substrate-binding protein [Pseudalkalibacillus hwajinpoensis]|uniref:ABC transporter substrate-binding protein n=1 Tax=Guptibacillus hwajinpoensis TaxID=208199 RepID=A0A4U1MNG4_9BACL|nr:ABC transporter substrate-binding protein [Pseudalkalibacillus hwajinpoensis]TKD72225.1 ABC transporter substrate-binding protein [Pseudalkalibacillus hwajinpoensis]
MLDAPGPWGTGPFNLTQGYSSIQNIQAIINKDPFSSTWITQQEERTPLVVLEANRQYWDPSRGPKVSRVVFKNDLSKEDALRLCMTTEGQVDIVTQVKPENAKKVRTSEYAKLVHVDGNKVFVGLFNRFKRDVDFSDDNLRLAFNLAIERETIIQKGFYGYAKSVPALTPQWAVDFPEGLTARGCHANRARNLLKSSGWRQGRKLKVATTIEFQHIATIIASQIQDTLQIGVEVTIYNYHDNLKLRRMLAEKKFVPTWDILLIRSSALFLEGTPAFFHREFFGSDGALRVGPKNEEFDQLFNKMVAQTDQSKLISVAKEIDRYAFKESLGLFICSPQDLYAVNRHVNFLPYRTTFELADTNVTDSHWSRGFQEGNK